MDDLIEGYRRFRAGTWQTERRRFEALSRLGQRPRALIIACSDSRTDPQMVFNARPGELFVVRNVANIAEPARQRAMQAPPQMRQDMCEHESVRLSLDNLMTFPWIKDAVEAGHITLHGCFFDIRSGILERLGADGAFHAIPD
jgi:carbonic anhydrase